MYVNVVLELRYLKYQVLIIDEIHKKTHKHQAWLISSTGTRASSGRRRPAQYYAFIAWRVPSPPPGTTPSRSKTPSRRRHGGDGSWWACWPDMFWLGKWSLSLQPPPLPLSPSRLSRTCIRVRPTATG